MLLKLSTLLLGVLFFAVTGFPQPRPKATGSPPPSASRSTTPFALEGVVRDNDGRGLLGAVVYATSRDKATTNNAGHYVIDGLNRSVATYLVHVEKAGYKFVPDRSSLHSPAKGNAHADFRAEPRKK